MYIFSTQNIELLFCDIPKEDGKKKKRSHWKKYGDQIFHVPAGSWTGQDNLSLSTTKF